MKCPKCGESYTRKYGHPCAAAGPRSPRWTVDAGRQILRDGVRIATVYSKVQTGELRGLFPADADDFTHYLCKLLNANDEQDNAAWWGDPDRRPKGVPNV